MKQIFLILGILIIILSIYLSQVGLAIYQNLSSNGKEFSTNKIFMNHSLLNKKIAIVISFRDFRDIEYFVPKNVFEAAGAEVITLSSKIGIAIGADGGEVKVDNLVSKTDVGDFDAVVFIGGSGMSKNLDNEDFQNLVQQTIAEKKVLGGICIAPVLLAKAGVLGGKKATVWSHYLTKEPINILKRSGAFYNEESVVVDGRIVTADGPDVSEQWAVKIVEVLSSGK